MNFPGRARTLRVILFIMAEAALFFAAAFATTLIAPRPASPPPVPAVFYPASPPPASPGIDGFWKGREIYPLIPQHNADRK